MQAVKPSPWPSAEKVIAVSLARDAYANARLHYAVRIAAMLAVLLAISLVGVFALWDRPPQFRYVLVDSEGKVLPQVPLNLSNHEDDFIVEWTVDAVTRLYSFDFVNYRQQFQEARKNLTAVGWESFEQAMKMSGNFNAVVANKFVTTAVPTGPGRITKVGDVMGRHAWKVEFPMLLSYRRSAPRASETMQVTNQNLLMSVTVIRQPDYLNEHGLGIRAIVAE